MRQSFKKIISSRAKISSPACGLILKTTLFINFILCIPVWCFSQTERFPESHSHFNVLAKNYQVSSSQQYLRKNITFNSPPGNSFNQPIFLNTSFEQPKKNYQAKRRLFVGLTIPLVTASLVANQANNKELAGAFALGGLATSSLALYFTIKDDRARKTSGK